MMNIIEEAIIYATVMHQGKVRKYKTTPYILHPLEVAQILSTLTDDQEIIAAGILHDIVEDTDGTLEEIDKRFGDRVATLVASESEIRQPGEEKRASWKRRKEESLLVLKNSRDIGVKMLWLADKLSNMRSLAGMYSELGEDAWTRFNQNDPEMHHWYYKSIAEQLELSLNKTGAFKELITHINYIWPGTFDSEKARYRKYKEVSVEGCTMIGSGAKGDVYRYNEELVIKVFNQNNTYADVEREIALSRRAFILGIPTAISFGIVSVGDCYGAMYELVDSETISRRIAMNPSQAGAYGKMMAELAHTIHSTEAPDDGVFPNVKLRLLDYVESGLSFEDEALAEKCRKLINDIPDTGTLVHGDFHTGNVFMQKNEPLLIDMDRLSVGHPVAEISDLYYFYVVLGEDDPSVVEKYMGFSYKAAKRFFNSFIVNYLDTDDKDVISDVLRKASVICNIRLIHKMRKRDELSENDRRIVNRCLNNIEELTTELDSLAF